MAEKFFWADAIADKIIKERVKDKNGEKKEIVCASGITPSGTIHIGNFREVITTDMIVKTLENKGKKVRFIYSWDDYDRLRKVPANIPEEKKKDYENYIGMPVSGIPSPFGKNEESYARFFEKQFEDSLKKVSISPEFIYQNQMNKKCKYAKLINHAIKNRKKIMAILNKYRKEPLAKDWYPITIYCEKCKKDTTKVLNIDKTGYIVEYSCKCGFKGKVDYRKKGIVKAPWRVDWPMRWKYEGVNFEPGGIDHSVYGGSFMTSKEIVKIFDYIAPLYQLYEWIRIKGGKAFSSSTGNVTTLNDVEEIYEPEILRYLFVGTRPNKSFDISFDNDVIKIYEDFDALEEKYYSGKANPQEKRMYELSVVNPSKKQPKREGFRHLITTVQIGKDKNLKGKIKERAKRVKNWLEKYAGEDMKFTVQIKIERNILEILNEKQKQALKELKKSLENKKFTEEKLFNEFYIICQKLNMKNTEFFDACYRIIINKRKGPRLASLILSIGQNKIAELLEEIK